MKTNNKYFTIYILVILSVAATSNVFGQEEEKKDYQKLDFLVTTVPTNLASRDGSPLVNLKLDIMSEEITYLDKVYVKVTTVEPREIYFIRAINKNVLTGAKDVKEWEKETAEIEKDREKKRLEKSQDKKYKEYKELWSTPRYEKQKGKHVTVAQMERGNASLEFGPFSPGDYEVYVQVKDESQGKFIDTHKITISSEVERTK